MGVVLMTGGCGTDDLVGMALHSDDLVGMALVGVAAVSDESVCN